jgi:Glycoside hydrolase 123, catalytic domain
MPDRAIAALLVGVCVALPLGVAAFSQGEPSLMANGGFELGTGAVPSGWSLSVYPGEKPVGDCLTRSREHAHSGDWALKVDTGSLVGQAVTLVFNGAIAGEPAGLRGKALDLSGFVFVQPETALRPIHMRLRMFGPDEQGQNAFLGDVLEVTLLGRPGTWTEFRASGTVADKAITGMDLHCSIGPDVVRAVQFLDDIRLEQPAPKPLSIRPLRGSVWRDEAAIPVLVTVAGGAEGELSLRLVDAQGREAAKREADVKPGVVGLALPKRPLPEGHYLLRAELQGRQAEAPIDLVASPWEGPPSAGAPAGATTATVQPEPGFEAMGSRAPAEAPDAVPAQPEPTSGDVDLAPWQAKGYVVFSRSPFDLVSRLGRPRPGEIGPVRLFACPGEYEPAALSVWALKPQAGVTVAIGALRAGKAVIPGSSIAVQTVRMPKGLPPFLERRATADIVAGQTQTFWLTVHVPAKAPPGFYRGVASVRSDAGALADTELLLRVLPLELPPVQKGYGFWWKMDGRWKGYYSDQRETALEQIRKQFVLLREHGCNTVSCYGMPKISKAADGTLGFDFSQDHWGHDRFSFSDFLRLGRETGFLAANQPIQYPGAESLHSDWIARELGIDHGSPAFDDFYRDACKRVNEWAKGQGFTLAFACVDEIGNSVERQQEALRFYRDAQESGALTSVTDNSMHGGRHLMAEPRFDEIIAMRVYNFITPEMIANTRASKDRLWLYNLGSGGWSPKLDRFVFGLFTERCGAEGYLQWAFQWPGASDPYEASEAGQSPGWNYALPAPDGPLPTLGLEAAREGIDDARYLALVRTRAPESEAASLDDIEPVSTRIRDYLDTHDAASLDARRWRMAREAMGSGR